MRAKDWQESPPDTEQPVTLLGEQRKLPAGQKHDAFECLRPKK
jgi:hypothetical protein